MINRILVSIALLFVFAGLASAQNQSQMGMSNRNGAYDAERERQAAETARREQREQCTPSNETKDNALHVACSVARSR